MNFLKLQFVVAGILVLGSGAALAQQGAGKPSTTEGPRSYLSDPDGKTLYWFTKDSAGKSTCTGPCLEKWPVFYQEKVTPPAGANAKDYGIIIRDDGKKQTTFRGYPLYYYSGDKKPGDTMGRDLGADWSVIDPSAFPSKGTGSMSDSPKGTSGADPHKGMTQGADPHMGTGTPAAPTKKY